MHHRVGLTPLLHVPRRHAGRAVAKVVGGGRPGAAVPGSRQLAAMAVEVHHLQRRLLRLRRCLAGAVGRPAGRVRSSCRQFLRVAAWPIDVDMVTM